MRYKKIIVWSSIFALLFFGLGFVRSYSIPQLKKWLLLELIQFSDEQGPVHLKAENLSLEFFPPALVVHKLTISPKEELKKVFLPITFERVTARLSRFALLKGQLRIGLLDFNTADVRIFIKPNDSPAPKGSPQIGDLEFKFSDLKGIPIDTIALRRIRFGFDSEVGGFRGATPRVSLRLQNQSDSLRLRVLMQNLTLQKDKDELTIDIVGETVFNDEKITINAIRLKRDSSYLTATGDILGSPLKGEFKKGYVELDSKLNLNEVTLLLRDILGRAQVPQLQGLAEIKGRVETQFQAGLPQIEAELKTTDFAVEKYKIGEARLAASFKDGQARLENFSIKNMGGEFKLDKTRFQTVSPYQFETTLLAQNIHIGQLLGLLSVQGVPVTSQIRAELPCRGQLEPKLLLECQGEIKDSSIRVDSEKPDRPIVEFTNLSAKGQVKVTDQKTSFQVEVARGDSRAKGSGVVLYDKGFDIQYESSLVDFKDIQSLAGLLFEGRVNLKGQTSGDSRTATFNMDLSGENIYFENYWLGDASTQISYKSGSLYLTDFKGRIHQSQYQSQIRVNFRDNTIDVDGKAPLLSLEDLQDAISKNIPLPLEFNGTGSATFKVKGPLVFNQLSSQINSSFFRGDIQGETFDQLHLSFQSVDGELKTDRIQFIRGQSILGITGTLSPTGQMKGYATARQFFIDQSETLKKLKFNVAGALQAEAELGGYFLAPIIKARGRIDKMKIGDQPVASSEFELAFDTQKISGQAQVFGEQLKIVASWPFQDNQPYSILLESKKWNIAQLFSHAADAARSLQQSTQLTAQLQLSGARRDWNSTSGQLKIDEFFVKTLGAEIQLEKPFLGTVQNGSMSNSDLALVGENSLIKIRTENSHLNNLKLKIDGRLDILLASLLAPFLDDIRGQLTLNVSLSGPAHSPDMMGSLILNNGYTRLKAFPHPFENIRADMSVSQKKIAINSVRGRLAGGLFSGQGEIDLGSSQSLPIQVKGSFQDCSFSIPEGLQTRGGGEFYIFGDKEPYTLGGIFSVIGGSFEKKINTTSTVTSQEIRPSPFLPKFLAQKASSPIQFDLEVLVQNPVSIFIEMPQVIIRTSADGRLVIRGLPEDVLLSGRLNLVRNSTFTVRSNTFNMTSGLVEYKNSPPDNPEIAISAEGRVNLSTGENIERDYDVFIRLNGPAQKPDIQMTSNPPLSERELISLVTLGFVRESDNATDVNAPGAQASTTGYQIGSQFIDNQLGINRRLEETLGLNLNYSSSFDANDQAARHTFVLRKQWSPRFGTSASRSVGRTDTNRVRAEYKLNRNLSVVGHWEGKEQAGAENGDERQGDLNIFGVDIEFKREFK